jgi:F0F1-type ATP synthase membrane subunit c/vacuolar-type H+-ATPase subunit K
MDFLLGSSLGTSTAGEGGAQGAARRGGTQGQLFIRERLIVFTEEP